MYPHILLRNRQTRSFHPVICWSGSSVHEPRYQAWLPLTDIIHQQKRSKHDGSREKLINLSMCLSTSLSHPKTFLLLNRCPANRAVCGRNLRCDSNLPTRLPGWIFLPWRGWNWWHCWDTEAGNKYLSCRAVTQLKFTTHQQLKKRP